MRLLKTRESVKKFELLYNCTLFEYKNKDVILFKNNIKGKVFKVTKDIVNRRVRKTYNFLCIAEIINKIEEMCIKQNFTWLDDTFVSAKSTLIFEHNITKVLHKTNWDTIKSLNNIPVFKNKDNYKYKTIQKLKSLNMIALTENLYNDKEIITIKCLKCNHIKNIQCLIIRSITHCTNCENKTKNNNFINRKKVLRKPNLNYFLYFAKFEINNSKEIVYKIGLFKSKYLINRFSHRDYKNPEILYNLNADLYKLFYIEQYIIDKYKNFKYLGKEKFAGYTECFNETLNFNNVIQEITTLFEEIQNRKPCELLETPEEDNQQLSIIEI